MPVHYEARMNAASPRGRAKDYSRFYKHIALVVTDGQDAGTIRDSKHTRIVEHVRCICVGSTRVSRGFRILARYERLAARANRLLAYRAGKAAL